jgi:hypothetical protein
MKQRNRMQRELIKRGAKIASEKYPNGFNKKQLIECCDEVFDGRGKDSMSCAYRKIEDFDDINNLRNAMYYINGNYPASITDCYVVGINGDCGLECPVYLAGKCECEDEIDVGSFAKRFEGSMLICNKCYFRTICYGETPDYYECSWFDFSSGFTMQKAK